MQEFILNGAVPLKSKIVINNNHNVSVNANIGPSQIARGQFYDEESLNMKAGNIVIAKPGQGALVIGNGGGQIFQELL